MAQYTIPISTLFTQVFGITGSMIRRYAVTSKDTTDNSKNIYNVFLEDETEEEENLTNMLGLPVQFPMGLVAGKYNYIKNGVVDNKQYGGMMLPYTSVASFSRSKRLTETYMSGYKGSVIEQYGFEPWNIRIQGFMIAGQDQKITSVADQVKDLQQYEEVCDAIEVKGKVFEWLKINRVAIMSINYPEARDLDMTIIKPYEMQLKSVEPIELILP